MIMIKQQVKGGGNMAQTTMVNFRMDTEAKKEVEEICSKMGLTMTCLLYTSDAADD